MKRLLINSCFLLFAIQLASASTYAHLKTDDVKPLNILNYYSKASLTVQANVYFGDEDEETVPLKTNFYLLDKDLISILKRNGFKPSFSDKKQSFKLTNQDYLSATAQAFSSDDENSNWIRLLIIKAISENQIAKIRTDEFGSGKTKTIPTGSYYLFGISRVNDEVFIWNQLIKIKSGINKIEIDQHNSDFIFEAN